MTPVVDISEHQGDVDFRTMRARGVEGLILRATHGQTVDARAARYFPAALDAGFAPHEILWYSFINPKRGSGAACAEATATAITRITDKAGVKPSGYMFDTESYRMEGPKRGFEPVRGPAYVAWLEEHLASIGLFLPNSTQFGYSNASYYDRAVGDRAFASRHDWIVPRYPAYSFAAYLFRPLPADASGWTDWAVKSRRAPVPPTGARGCQGWQFSAGWNRQGARYGASSRDLDLNIIDPAAWARWARSAPIEQPQPLPPIVTPSRSARMFFAVVNDKTRPAANDRWLWNGIQLRPLADEQDFLDVAEIAKACGVPVFNDLATPYGKSPEWISAQPR
jgi:Glycosyl hydrolases family 25